MRWTWNRMLLVLGAGISLMACDGGMTPLDLPDGDVPLEDGSMDDLDGAVEEETVCDGGCWVRRCREVTYASGDATGALDIGEMRDGSYVPYTDGGEATLVFGFQGGVMIEPVIRVPMAEIGADDCVQVTIRNRPDPAYPELAGELEDFAQFEWIDPLRPNESGVLSATLPNQLGWNTPPQLRMILEVEARGVDWVRSTQLALHVVDADGFDECDTVPTDRGQFGCVYDRLEGTLTVDAVGERSGLACADTVDVTVTLEPDLDLPDTCFALTHTIAIPRGCIDADGVAAGQTIEDATLELYPDCPVDPIVNGLRTEDCGCE